VKPTRYEILRDVVNGSKLPLKECPVRVWTLLDEKGFEERGPVHWHTAFLEDRYHDWDWKNGTFRFYGHSGEPGDKQNLIIVYEL
jgi:hypothetical protein